MVDHSTEHLDTIEIRKQLCTDIQLYRLRYNPFLIQKITIIPMLFQQRLITSIKLKIKVNKVMVK